MNIPGYDARKLQGPDDDRPEVGTEEGDTCNRWQEPDEDCPKAWQCKGTMILEEPENCACHISPPCSECEGLGFVCDICGEMA